MRLVILTDSDTVLPATLVRATVAAAARRGDTITAVATSRPDAFAQTPIRRLTRPARDAMASIAEGGRAGPPLPARRVDLAALRRAGIPFVPLPEPAGGDAVARWIHDELRADVLLSFSFLRLLRPPLLGAVDAAVNLHPGALPAYRGLGTTAFELYNGEAFGGYSFHYMTPRVDAGPVLVAGVVPIRPDDTRATLIAAKAQAAAARVEDVLGRIARREPGREQVGEAHLYTRAHVSAMTTVEHPDQFGADEVLRRLRAFGSLDVRVGDQWWPVTGVRPARRGDRLVLRTADRRDLAIVRIGQWPVGIARARRRVGKRRATRGARA